MKHLIQSVIALLVFCFMIVCAAITANAARLDRTSLSSACLDAELPPDIFDDDCDGGPSCPGHQFDDMPPVDHWSHVPIDWALRHHIAFGTSETTFSPKTGCTRAQAVTFLRRAAGSPEPDITDCPFTDVPEKAYYRKAVLWAYENRIAYGTSAASFSPNAKCRRSQIITFLWRAKGAPQPAQSDSVTFLDVSNKAYYHDAVVWAVAQRITSGTSGKTFGPNLTCKREQIVCFLFQRQEGDLRQMLRSNRRQPEVCKPSGNSLLPPAHLHPHWSAAGRLRKQINRDCP